VETRIEYFERMLADNRTGLLALANATKTRRRSSDATWRPTSVSVLIGNTSLR